MTIALLIAMLLEGSLANGDETDNPEFVSWAGFQLGAWVKIHEKGRRASLADGNATLSTPELSPFDEAEITWKLVEVAGDKAVLEGFGWTIADGRKKDVSGQKREVPAKVRKAAEARPARGKEDLRIGQNTVPCQWEDRVLGSCRQPVNGNMWEGKTVVRSWRSDRVPGGLVKELTEAKGPKGVGKETRMVDVLEWSGEPRAPSLPEKSRQ